VSIGSIGSLTSGQHSPATASAKDKSAALEGQIRLAREQLNDWVTCVSATTPKGKAEIGSLSAQISAAQQHISQLQQTASTSVDLWA
jgi:hypothetical protein